ncbi:STAS domain-containing protein [Micromonospora sp. NPDC127501]|uniref:STAS domain-containing protein n=1 Tax=Micromonospora sp. NPDC127501 TaxID=3154872 RepID=UPI00331A2919
MTEGSAMADATVDIDTSSDGTLVIRPRGLLDVDDAVDLRRTVVRAIRHDRPPRLVVDLRDVHGLDPIYIGTIAAACDDQRVAVFLDYPSIAIADQLVTAGVPAHRLRHVGTCHD